jgi:hypothetical protein
MDEGFVMKVKKYKELPQRFEPGLLSKVDGRSSVLRKLRRSYDTIVDELGGEETLPLTKLVLIERFVFLEACLETWEHQIAAEPSQSEKLLSRWIQGINSLSGLAKTIGLKREAKTARSLKAYVEGKAK